MRKLLLLPITVFFLFSFFTANAQAGRETGDNPAERDRQAAEKMKDPALGYVPYHRLLNAINHTEALKAASRNSNTSNLVSTPLNWIERGPIFDSVGPSNGNTRGGPNTAGGYTSGRIRAFLLDTLNDPTGNTAFTAGVAGGLWKCTNFLAVNPNWVPIDDRFSSLAISSIGQNPANPQIIYFATGEPTSNADAVYGAGLWKSTNGGTTFTFLPSTSTFLRSFKVACDAAGNVYLACRITSVPLSQQNGLYRSTNGGTSWTDITPDNLTTNKSCTDFEFTASGKLNATFGYLGSVVNQRYTASPATVTASTWLSGSGFRVSNTSAVRTEMAVLGETLYALTVNTSYNFDSCYKSTDGGVNWTKQNTVGIPTGSGNGQGWYSISLAINPLNPSELFCGGLDAYRSTNDGATWTRFTYWVTTAPYVHADHHYGQYWISGGQTRLIMCTDGGVFYSTDNGATFVTKNKNLGIKQFYSAAIHPAAGSPYLLAGAQDNGTHSLSNPGLSYSIEVTGGDGCIVHINQQNPQIQFGSYVYNQYRRSTNGGASWSSINLSNNTGQFVNPFDYDDAQNIMYCGNTAATIRRWDNANTSGSSIVFGVTNMTGSLLSAKYSPYTANRLFFGTNAGKLYRLDNANVPADATSVAAVDITGSGFPNGTIICVNTGTNDNNLVATYSNYGINNVWVSTNGGTSWSAIDGDLPDMPVRWAMFEPGSNAKLYLATEAGIYTTTNINGASTQWLPETTFPTVSTYMLKMRTSDSTIVAGTHGRGLWTSKIPGVIATNPTVTINQAAAQPDPTTVTPINFTVVFDQAVTGFTTGDVTLSGTAGATIGTVTGGPTTYNVAVTGMTSSGTVIATIAAGVCQNALAEPNLASTSTDNTVTFNIVTNNDACTGALPIACGQTITGTTVGASLDAVPTCTTALNTAPGVWYTFVGDGQNTTLSLCGSGYDTKIGVFTGTCAAPVCVIGNDDFCGLQSQVSFTTVNATTYYVLVTGFGTNAGAFTLARTCAPLPTNDDCANAVSIACGQSINGTTAGQTIDAVPTCTTALNTAPGVWYKFTGDGYSNTLSLCAGTAFDSKIGVFTGTCAAPVCVIGNDDFCGLQSQVTFNTTLGTNYLVLVTGFGTATGAFTLTRTCAGPVNDACFGALPIACGQTITGTTIGATPDPVPTCTTVLNTAPSLWYTFVGNGVPNTLSLCGSAYDTKIGIFTGTCVAPVCVLGNDDFCGLQSEVTFTPVLGTTYYVLVTGFSTNAGAFTLNRTCALPACPPSTITPAAATICGGTIQMLTASNATAGNHVWAPLTELYTNAAATVPYTGTAVNVVYLKPSATRTYTATLQSPTCNPTPASVTITVNPNPDLIIVADPGTTLCEGDPTLLTVYNSAGFANIALTQSSSQVPVAGSVSCNAGGLHTDNSYWRAYNLAPLGLPSALTVTTVTFGVEQAAGGAQPVTVNIYSQDAGPAFPGGTRTLLGSQAASVPNQALTLFTVTFATPVIVPSNAVMIVELFTPSGQATGRSFFIGSNPAAQTGTSYLSAAACGVATPTDVAAIGFPNMHIILNVGGTVGSTGAIATGTFLWSPAAGLSSTTSNPVAASPMNTTTYTVVRTTAGGCSASANITITVNKRPTVTVQPVASVNCATTAATFTVTGTGTNLTYRWQESTTGVGGPWTNLADGGIYSGTGTASLVINPVSGLMNGYAYRCILSGICAPIGTNNISNPALLTVNPLPVVAITPSVTCGGVAGTNGVALSVGSAPPPVPGSCTTSSGAISIAVPDNTANGVQATLAVSCVPANATVTGIRVNLNMPGHTFVGDMIFNLKAPNGAILNLDKYMSATATQAGAYPNSGFVNATISSSGTAALGGATTTPITGTWKADLINGTVPFVVQDPAGFVSTATAWSQLFSVPNGTWTLAMADGGPGDVGTLTSWSVTVEYTTPGTTGSTNTYVWSPLAGLYNDPLATSPYTGTNAIVVYAAPTVFTVYTVTATNTATGCVNTAQAFVNYTPPPPSVTPNPVAMCLGDGPVRLISSSSTTTVVSAASGPISIAIPDGTGAPAISNLSIAGVPAASTIGEVKVTMNMSHTWVGDVDVNLKAPNGAILNLVGGLDGGAGGNATDNFTNTAFSSLGGATISGAAAPRTGTYAAEARVGYGPTGYIQTGPATWGSLTPTPTAANGTWTLAMGDFAGGDAGTLTSWSISVSYIVGVQSTPATWAPTAGLFNDALASSPYTGTPRDTVWTQPTPSGVYNYDVTVQSLPAPPLAYTNPAPISIPVGGVGTPYPSNLTVSGLPTTGATVKSVVLNSISHTWSEDVDVLLQSPSGVNVILMSDVGGIDAINATYTFADSGPAMSITAANQTGTYKPTNNGATDNFPAPGPGNVTQANPALSLFTGNMNGVWKLFALDDDGAGDQGNIAGGYTINFDIGITACTSPARRVVVTVNTPTSVATQPVNATVCTDKVATFSVVAAGTGPFSYRWEVSTNGGNPPWTTVNNGGVYSGATTATLTITAPPVTMTGYQYRVIITGAAPCAAVTSFTRILTVNPLPTIVIKADPYTSLFPGLVTTLSSTVTPAAANSYTWLLNGTAVPNAITGTLNVNVDGLGDYQLRVTDINGCTNISNTVTIKDSVTGKCYIYPNPTSGVFQVRYYSAANNVQLPRTLTVYDAKGDRVLTQRYAIGRPYDRMDVDMRAYGKGLYWVEIGDRNGNRLTMCRVVIQ